MVWGLTVGVGGGLDGRGQREENWDNCNSINNKIFKLKIERNKKQIHPRKLTGFEKNNLCYMLKYQLLLLQK